MTRKERYREVLDWFSRSMPVAETELSYDTPFHLLVAVILSAQCTDKRINLVTQASLDTIFSFIRSVSYPNNKARSLLGMAKMLVEEFDGEVPSDIDSLMRLPGVGRKTANVMLAVVWNKAAMAVDTHVFRVSERIGLTTGSRTPLATEKTLCENIPEEVIPKAHHWLILHGRYVCKARKPDCLNCGLTHVCRYFQQENKKQM